MLTVSSTPPRRLKPWRTILLRAFNEIVLWSVAPEAMTTVIEQAQAPGIKVVAFVAPTEKYDATMLADDARLADYLAKLAAKWIDETFADAADHSVPVAVIQLPHRQYRRCTG